MNFKTNKEYREKQERSTDEIARSLLINSISDNNMHNFYSINHTS